MTTHHRTNRQQRPVTGTVVKLYGSTAQILVVVRQAHPLYKKIISKHRKFTVDTNSTELSVGKRVSIAPCRPISKTKSWKIVGVENDSK